MSACYLHLRVRRELAHRPRRAWLFARPKNCFQHFLNSNTLNHWRKENLRVSRDTFKYICQLALKVALKPANEFKATAVLPYVKGLSEQLRRCLQQQGVRAVFKSETTLRSQLVRPKDAVNPAIQDGVVYRIPCEYRKLYSAETGRPIQDRIKEHDRDIRRFRACSQHQTQATLERSKVY